jgi:thymidine phosphorylase
MNANNNSRPQLKIRRVNLDTGRENVAVISRRSSALRPEVFSGFSRVELRRNSKVLLATLLLTDDDSLVGPDDLGLAEPAFRRFAEPVGSLVTVSPATPPNSLDAVRAKIQGRVLSAAEIGSIVDDVTHYRYSDMEIAAFLIGSASFMTSGELLALSQAMAQAGTQLKWDRPIVVDKHCIGGIPGNRTSMIVVPIVAAHGLTIPKTSSRAITSPAGTADTMEVLARVDLSVEAMKQVVTACHGCLVWGGHVNLSPADDIFISVERPLSIDTREQMVASIMSKKMAAGSTHLLIDLPIGPAAKLTNAMEAMRLRKLFEFVGDHFRHSGGSGDHRWPSADRQRHRSGARSPGCHGRAGERFRGAGRSAREIPAPCRPPSGIRSGSAWRDRICPGAGIARRRRGAQADAQDHRGARPFGLSHRSRDLDRRHSGIARRRRLGDRLSSS